MIGQGFRENKNSKHVTFLITYQFLYKNKKVDYKKHQTLLLEKKTL